MIRTVGICAALSIAACSNGRRSDPTTTDEPTGGSAGATSTGGSSDAQDLGATLFAVIP